MRADAQRRREAIVQAGRVLVAERGGEVPLETVAEAAGVGIATLYRNFATRAALLDEVALAILADVGAVVSDALATLAAEAPQAGSQTDPRADPGAAAWEDAVRRLVALDLGALTAALATHAADALAPEVREAQDRALARVADLLAAAGERGLVRGDVTPLELVVAVGVITRPQPAAVLDAAPGVQDRLVSILLDGLRPPARG